MNTSAVYWPARTFGFMKNALGQKPHGSHLPPHLILVKAQQQKQMFDRLGSDLELLNWEIEVTGWPYAIDGLIKRRIADVARTLGGVAVMGSKFGGLFRIIYLYMSDGSSPPAQSRRISA